MTTLEVKKAKRQKLKAVINLHGASGSGKSLSALLLAKGLMDEAFPELSDAERWAKIGVIDTEHDRTLYYAEREVAGVYVGEFLHVTLGKPYSSERHIEAFEALERAGAEVIILDSFTHAWTKEGGLLDLHTKLTEASRSKNSYTAWKDVNPVEAKLHDKIFYNNRHIITTMRSKQEYVMQKNELDKMEVVKLGTKVVQRDEVEYEYMLTFMVEMNHMARVGKDNTGLFDNVPVRLTPEVGQELHKWLDKGVDIRKIQEEERQSILGIIDSYRTGEFKAEIDALVTEFESKAKKPINEFSLEWVKKAIGLVEFKVNELQAAKPKEEKKKEKVAK
jgi:hypothetical protein